MKARGFSMIETMIAIFILAVALTFVATLFHRSFNYFNMSQQRIEAAQLAQTYLTRMRVEAQDLTRFRSGIPAFSSLSTTESGMRVETTVTTPVVTPESPSRTLESAFPLAERKTMGGSFLEAYVHVRWPNGPDPGVELRTLLAEPVRAAAVVEVVGLVPSPAPPTGFTLNAQLLDTSGDPISDVVFRWWVEPGRSRGTITPSNRFESEVVFTPTIRTTSGVDVPSPPGNCNLRVRAFYNGTFYENSPLIPVNI